MKRLVREIITLLKIERWLLDEGADHAIEASGDLQGELSTIEQLHLLPDGLSEAELATFLATCPPPAGTRLLTQRIVQVNQEERNQAGEVIDHS